MTNMTLQEYITECQSLADMLAADALQSNDYDAEAASEAIFDGMLHETIDGHEWIIYTCFNDDIVAYSANAEAYLDCHGPEDLGQLIIDKGLSGVILMQAYFAFEMDVMSLIDIALESALTAHEEA